MPRWCPSTATSLGSLTKLWVTHSEGPTLIFLFHFHRWNQKEGEKTRFSIKNDQLEGLGLVLLGSCVLTQAMGAVVAPGPDATSESLPWMFHTWPCVYFWRFAAWVQINKASPAQAAGWGGAAAGFGDNAGKGQGNGNTGQIFHINQRSKSCNQCCYFWWVNSGCLTLGIVWFCWSGMEWRHLFIQPAGIYQSRNLGTVRNWAPEFRQNIHKPHRSAVEATPSALYHVITKIQLYIHIFCRNCPGFFK